MTYQYRIVTPPAALPVTMEDLKNHLRIGHEDEDSLLAGYAAAAVNHLETVLNRPIMNQTIEQILPSFPARWPIELRGRVQQVVAITYWDGEAQQVLDPATYWVNTYAEPGMVSLSINRHWPTTVLREDAVRITYVSGFGDSPNDVPEALRQAILLLAGHWYESRVPVSVGATVSAMPFGVECLAAPYRLWSF